MNSGFIIICWIYMGAVRQWKQRYYPLYRVSVRLRSCWASDDLVLWLDCWKTLSIDALFSAGSLMKLHLISMCFSCLCFYLCNKWIQERLPSITFSGLELGTSQLLLAAGFFIRSACFTMGPTPFNTRANMYMRFLRHRFWIRIRNNILQRNCSQFSPATGIEINPNS